LGNTSGTIRPITINHDISELSRRKEGNPGPEFPNRLEFIRFLVEGGNGSASRLSAKREESDEPDEDDHDEDEPSEADYDSLDEEFL
jgi:hypothetical protein